MDNEDLKIEMHGFKDYFHFRRRRTWL